MGISDFIGINLIVFIVLVIMVKYTINNKERNIFEQNLFSGLIISNSIMLFLQILGYVFDYKIGISISGFKTSLATLYIMLAPVPCMLLSIYVHYQIYKDTKRIKKIYINFVLPLVFNFIISISNIYVGFIFSISQGNTLSKGRLFPIIVVICYSYLIYSFFILVKNKSNLDKDTFNSLFAFISPPFIGGIFQIIINNTSIVWVCMAISLLYMYIHSQNKELNTDYLTGLFNRRKLDDYLKQQLRNAENGKCVAGIMIDINSFKEINDYYGHSVGDQALIDTARILKSSVRKSDFVARYGGDEFVIVLSVKDQNDLNNAVDRIYSNIHKHNAKKITPYRLSLSIGYDIFDYESSMPMQQFFRHIDKLMYREKNRLAKRKVPV